MKKYIGLLALVLTVGANAGLITSIDEATIADGNHYHSQDGGRAAVGYWNSEETRAVFEFDPISILGDDVATLSFEYTTPEGLEYGHDKDYMDNFNIYGFASDGIVSISDFYRTDTLLGTASVAGLSVGDTLSIDISALLNSFDSNYLGYLGIVFDPIGFNWQDMRQETMFTNFQIKTTNDVPEPGSLLLIGLGLAGLGFSRRKQAA